MRASPNRAILLSIDRYQQTCAFLSSEALPFPRPVPSSALLLVSSWEFHKSFGWILSFCATNANMYLELKVNVLPLVFLSLPPESGHLHFWASTKLPYFWHPIKESGKSSTKIDLKSV